MTSNIFKDVELDAEQKAVLLSVVKMVYQSTEALSERHRREGDVEIQHYGLLMDFLHVAVSLTKAFKQEFKYRQELCSQAGSKLELAAKRVAEMEALAQKWKDSISQAAGEAAVRTERDVELITCQIDRAKDLLTSLSLYRQRWSEAVVSLGTRLRCCQVSLI